MELKTVAQTKAAIEAILFASGQPVAIKKLAQSLEVDLETTQRVMDILVSEYRETEDKGIEILKLENSYQMCAKKEYSELIRSFLQLKKNTQLSQAAMETLAIVAYNQPVSRSFVEEIRGVDCSGTLNMLVERELVMEAGRFELPGRPIAYKTTEHFLRSFELSSLEDLPDVNKMEFEDDEDISKATEEDKKVGE